MNELLTNSAACIALSASGIFFLTGLITGAWKYACIRKSPKFEAPFYVNTAHKAALMYAFAAQLIAVFATLSAFPNWVNVIATISPLLFFAIGIIHYIQLGLTTESNNSLRDSTDVAKDYLILNVLAVAEIGGFAVLLLGFFIRLFSA